jgi:antirestriction protein ArdC
VGIRKGEHGVRLVRMVSVDREKATREASTEEGGEVVAQEGSTALVMKTFTVFNASQVDGLAPLPQRQSDIKPHEAVEAIVHGMQDTGMKLNFGGSFPAFYPRTDAVHIPVAADFENIDQFHSTLLHELCHATGHPKRLARLHLDARFGSAEYGREELRAELGSLLMLATLGGELAPSKAMVDSNAAYISSWLDVLRRDKGEIFRAAADAQRICDYLSERALTALPRVSTSPKEWATEVADGPVLARTPFGRAMG